MYRDLGVTEQTPISFYLFIYFYFYVLTLYSRDIE